MPKQAPTLQRTRTRWNAVEARAVLDRLVRSGLLDRDFAAREGLDVQRLRQWRKRLDAPPGHGPAERERPAFIEVTSQSLAMIEVVLACGRVLRVTESIEPKVLRRLVEALDDGTPC